MKRSSSSNGGSEMNRLDTKSPSLFSKQTLTPQQQKQIEAHQELQQQQYQAHQQQKLKMQQLKEFQQQQQQQQMQEYQQQQYAANQYYNQAAFYNYHTYGSPQSSIMYNSGPSWNYISAPPPPLFGSSPSPIPHPPLPPPELKLEKPPLPKEPEPGTENQKGKKGGSNGHKGGGKAKGLNGMNGGPKPNGRRKNPHFFGQMQPPPMALAQDLLKADQFNDLSDLIEEEIPAGADKFTIFLNNCENGRIQVNKKSKRKPMSTRYTRTKHWVREEAEAAIALEKEFNQMQKRPMLILKFPDPDLNKYIVKKYSPFIDTVHFQQPSTPRYCFVQLKEGADVDKVVSTIRQIPFGTGHITAEVKSQHVDDQPVTPEEIDPYTLYIGNLPTHISVRVVKQYFPNAQRIDIGYAQRMRYTRYAFIRYSTVAEAMESYRKTVNALLESRSLIVRFRRQKGNIGLPGEPKAKLQRRDDIENETATMEQNASETSYAAQSADELVPEDQNARKGDEILRKCEKITEKVQEVIEKVETVSQQKSTVRTVDAKASDTSETAEGSQERNTSDELSADAKAATNPSVNNEKIVPTIGQSEVTNADTDKTSTTLNSTESRVDEGDSKQKVLDEANELIKRTNDRRAVSPINFSAFTEPTDPTKGPVEGDIKLENSDDEDSSDDGGINLLGTRIKDEPFETPHRAPMDELYFDDYDYDDLCTDLDDDDDNWSTNSDSRSRQLLNTNWDIVRRSELNIREEKPDLNEIRSLGTDSLQSSIDLAPIKANLELKQEVDDVQQPTQKIDRERLAVKQELEDMFNRLNSDGECDDEDAFFGHT